MDSYRSRAQALELEIAALETDWRAVQDGPERAAITARLASAKRSLEWYRSRLSKSRVITQLGVGVFDAIQAAERI